MAATTATAAIMISSLCLGVTAKPPTPANKKMPPKSSVLSLGLISKLSFYTSCVMVWLEDTSDDETE